MSLAHAETPESSPSPLTVRTTLSDSLFQIAAPSCVTLLLPGPCPGDLAHHVARAATGVVGAPSCPLRCYCLETTVNTRGGEHACEFASALGERRDSCTPAPHGAFAQHCDTSCVPASCRGTPCQSWRPHVALPPLGLPTAPHQREHRGQRPSAHLPLPSTLRMHPRAPHHDLQAPHTMGSTAHAEAACGGGMRRRPYHPRPNLRVLHGAAPLSAAAPLTPPPSAPCAALHSPLARPPRGGLPARSQRL